MVSRLISHHNQHTPPQPPPPPYSTHTHIQCLTIVPWHADRQVDKNPPEDHRVPSLSVPEVGQPLSQGPPAAVSGRLLVVRGLLTENSMRCLGIRLLHHLPVHGTSSSKMLASVCPRFGPLAPTDDADDEDDEGVQTLLNKAKQLVMSAAANLLGPVAQNIPRD